MIIPISDSPRDPHHRPWATLGLIAFNVVMGLATLPLVWVAWDPTVMPELSVDTPANRLVWVYYTFGFRPSAPSLFTAMTSEMLHAGVLHLGGNMLYLWVYGPNVERRMGGVPFLLLYLTAGLLGSMLYALVSIGSPIPSIGASGAISGVLGAYLILFPFNRIRLLLYFYTIRVPAWLLLVFFVVVDNVLPFVTEASSSIGHAAHLGGFFGGMVLAIGLRWVQPARASRKRVDPLLRARCLVEQGMLLDAHQAFADLTSSSAPGVAAEAQRTLIRLEANPTYQRASQRG